MGIDNFIIVQLSLHLKKIHITDTKIELSAVHAKWMLDQATATVFSYSTEMS